MLTYSLMWCEKLLFSFSFFTFLSDCLFIEAQLISANKMQDFNTMNLIWIVLCSSCWKNE